MTPLLGALLGLVIGWYARGRYSLINQSALAQLLENIMTKVSEVAALINDLRGKVTKIHQEVQTLKDSLNDVDLPPEAQAALDNLSASLSALDELNPDAPTPPTVTE
jgi:uncharacterized coiled-coil DUF342 family protein